MLFMSSWLRQHIRERDGVFNITTRLVIAG
jgi:hypothetical protein